MPSAIRQLSQLFKPEHYDIEIDLSKSSKKVFTGKVKITGQTFKKSKTLTLHSKGLEIITSKVNGQDVTFTTSNDELELNGEFIKGKQFIEIGFKGAITDTLSGIYISKYKHDGKNQEVIVTQFESHAAREVFPCLDEPGAKATFDLTLATKKLTALSNTPIKSQRETATKLITKFEPTPKMSTYLMAFVVGDLSFTETTSANGVKVRAYSTKEFETQTEFAANLAAKFLDYFDDYFGLPYPLPKCDLVAVPDFSAGAMENWGLVTFRESCMLVNEDTSVSTKQFNAMVIGHELAHQWFGNLVTMKWWDDLWLNESFANWMGYKVVDHFYPEWRYWEQFNGFEALRAYNRDSLATVQSIRQPVNDPEDITTMFDTAIMYSKGACLVRMLHDYLGEDAFRSGMRSYIKKFAYKNATMADLWDSLADHTTVDVPKFIEPWLTQPGHPVLSFRQTNGHATINQRRFFADPRIAREDSASLWAIPLLSDSIEQKTLETRSASVQLVEPSLNLLNQGAGGFYNVQYDKNELAQIIKNISDMPTIDRQKLLQDTLMLTQAGLETTTDTLKLLAAFKNERQFSVWTAISSIVSGLNFLTADSPEEPLFNHFVINLIQPSLDRLGVSPLFNESYNDAMLRPVVLNLAVASKQPEANKAMLNAFRLAEKPTELPSEGREIFYKSTGKVGTKDDFNKLLRWYKSTSDAQEKFLLAAGLTGFNSSELTNKSLNLLKTATVRNQDVVFWLTHLMKNAPSRARAWRWAKDNWQWLKTTFDGDYHYGELPKCLAIGLSTQAGLEEFNKFFTPKLAEGALKRSILQAQEDIQVKILWRQRDEELVKNFLISLDLE